MVDTVKRGMANCLERDARTVAALEAQPNGMRAGNGDELPCDACDGIANWNEAWECACTSIPAYRCGTDGVARLCVCVRLSLANGIRDYETNGEAAADVEGTADATNGTDAAGHDSRGYHIRSGRVRYRLHDPRIGLVSVVERPLYVSEADGRHVAADEAVHEFLRSLVPDDRDDVLAWASGFGDAAVQQVLQGYGDWWRRRGAAEAIRDAVGNDARCDIAHCDTCCFPMRAHAITYSCGDAFEVWTQLDGDGHVTVTSD